MYEKLTYSLFSMTSFDNRMGSAVSNTGTKGWLVAILELGAWFGVLWTGYLCDKFSRKYTIVIGMLLLLPVINDCKLLSISHCLAVCVFCIGVIVQTSAMHPSSIFGGSFVSNLISIAPC